MNRKDAVTLVTSPGVDPRWWRIAVGSDDGSMADQESAVSPEFVK